MAVACVGPADPLPNNLHASLAHECHEKLLDRFDAIPQELKDRNNFVCWKNEIVDGRQTKVPYNARTGKKAMSNNRSTWSSFGEAVDAARDSTLGYNGIGFELEKPFIGFDFDGVIHDGNVEPYVDEVLRLLSSPYAEITPSGKGVRAIVKGVLPGQRHKVIAKRSNGEKYGVEIYDKGRYLTLTGNRYSGSDVPPADLRVPYRLCFDERFRALWLGDISAYNNDHSNADLALCGMLRRTLYDHDLTPEDADRARTRIEEWFNRSRLGQREKWQRREDYRRITIDKALSGEEPQPSHLRIAPPTSSAPVAIETTLVRECFADVEAKPIVWLWKDRIPKGKLTIFSGNPDCGKTTVLIDVISRYTTGRAYPDGAENAIEPRDVLMLIAEDDPGDTIKPRLMAAGADLSRVSYLKAVQVKNGAKQIERMLALDHDLDLLEKSLRKNPNIGLVTLDPISGYLGKAELNKEQELRRVLVPIKELAEKLGVTFIGLGHFNKRSDVSALHKVGGAVAMSGVPRAVWMFAKNPEADDEYLMLLGKGNLTKKRTGMKYRFGEKLLPNGFDAPFIVWQGDSVGDADSVFTVAGDPTEKRKAKAKRFLADYLADGDQKSEDIEAKGKAQGISRGALFEAKKEMGIKAEKSAGQWWWSLPKEAQEFQQFH